MNETKATKRRIAPVARIVKLEDQDRLDLEYWLSRSPEERFNAVHEIRKEYSLQRYGSYGRLQRVYRIVKRV